MQPFEIVFGGQGGQGVRLASTILGRACASMGKQVASSAAYGPEVRGTFTRSEVIVSDEFIVYPRVLRPNVFIALSQEAYDRVAGEVPADGLILYEAETVKPVLTLGARQLPVPAIRMAGEIGHSGSANMVMLGVVAAITALVNLDTLKRALPNSRRTENEAALQRGWEFGQSVVQRGNEPNAPARTDL